MMFGVLIINFNSTIVRLKAINFIYTVDAQCRFQFYDSTIKRYFFRFFDVVFMTFQFYDSTIKSAKRSAHPNLICLFQFYDSTIKRNQKATKPR